MPGDEVRVNTAARGRASAIAIALFSAAASGWFGSTHAQEIRLPAVSAGPRTLSGIVTDETGKPLADIDVFVEELQARTRTAPTGKFIFTDVKEGKYTVGARSIGYEAVSNKVTVKDSGVYVAFKIKRTAFSLASVITTAARGGLSGVVADTGMRALSSVRIRVVGEQTDLRTDSAGRFFAPLKPGRYLVRLERDGFTRQLIGVTVPADSGRNLAAWMVPQRGGENVQEGANLLDMNVRLVRRKPVSTLYFSREDITKTPHHDLRAFLQATEGRMIDQSCWVDINGGPRKLPIWKVFLEDIEFLEVYPPEQQRTTSGPRSSSAQNMAANRASTSAVALGECRDKVIAWLRR